ncbi:MAG: DUF58 domain-containing protein [Candidatus Dormibacteria bacterium]
MTARPSARLLAYTVLVGLALVAALVLARPALVALAAPFALWLVVGAALASRPEVAGSVRPAEERPVEEDLLGIDCSFELEGRVGRLELSLDLPPGLEPGGKGCSVKLLPRAGQPVEVHFEVRPTRWGVYQLPALTVRAHDPLSLFTFTGSAGASQRIRVYPQWARLRRLVPPLRTQVYSGNRIARQHGEGLEFADIRSFVPGDRVRRINWRVTARTGVPFVNDFHMERNSDVILFVDNFSELGQGRDSVLSLAVRAATALAEGHLRERDRVGVIGFGGLLRWLLPGMGSQHLYRVVETMLDTEVVASYAWRAIDVIPARVLPPAATVIALSPLLDPRTVGAVVDLEHRGFDLMVLEISAESLLGPAAQQVDPLAVRMWTMLRQARRHRLLMAGIPVTHWLPDQPLEAVLAQAREYRRFAPRSIAR